MNLENEPADDLSDDALDVFEELESDEGEALDADPDAEDIEDDAEGDPDGDDSDEDDEQSEEANGEDDQPKGKTRTQKRIDKLTREKNDARREADYHRQQLENVQTQFDSLQNQIQVMQPTQQQFQQGMQQGLDPQEVQRLVRQQASDQVEQERFTATVSAVKETLQNNDAGEALTRLSNPALTAFEPEAITALSEAKFPAKVANAIANNEEVFDKFAALKDGVARARFIDRLDGRLESRATAKPKSKAKPTPRVRGAAKRPDKDPDDMNQAEYEAHARKQGWLE